MWQQHGAARQRAPRACCRLLVAPLPLQPRERRMQLSSRHPAACVLLLPHACNTACVHSFIAFTAVHSFTAFTRSLHSLAHWIQDVTEFLEDMREFDVPYHVRFAIDLDVRCGHWYTVRCKVRARGWFDGMGTNTPPLCISLLCSCRALRPVLVHRALQGVWSVLSLPVPCIPARLLPGVEATSGRGS